MQKKNTKITTNTLFITFFIKKHIIIDNYLNKTIIFFKKMT